MTGGEAERLMTSPNQQMANALTKDGKSLVFAELHPKLGLISGC